MSERDRRLRAAVVGLRFGAAFVPIYQDHPDVAEVALFDLDPAVTATVADKLGRRGRATHLAL